ncbi:MAG: NAD(P)H-hydrate dehydratase [Flexilinea sp.]
MKLVTIGQMRQIEKEAFECGISYEQMMRTAGTGIAEKIILSTKPLNKTVCGIIGSGNNGGDTLIALTELARRGWTVFAWIINPNNNGNDWLHEFCEAGGISVFFQEDKDFHQLDEWVEKCDILLDGALGIGVHLPLREDYSFVFSHIRIQMKNNLPFVIAVDCPSGMDCDTGAVDPNCLNADITICIEAVKLGEVLYPAYLYIGKLEIVSLNLPGNLAAYSEILRNVIQIQDMEKLMPQRAVDGNKGTFGTVSIIGGSDQYIGAPVLSGKAAYKTGCGLVKMFVPSVIRNIMGGQIPEAVWTPIDINGSNGIEEAIQKILDADNKKGSVVLGPGFGLEQNQNIFMKNFLAKVEKTPTILRNPIVIDANGLGLLAEFPGWYEQISGNCVLTPHPGEMSKLCGISIQEIQANRVGITEKYSALWNKVIVLKGAYTVVAAPDGRSSVLPVASSALAKAGSGDILSGIIAGLLAQGGIETYHAACLGIWIHGTAGITAQKQTGNPFSVMASDILASIPEAINDLIEPGGTSYFQKIG